MSESDRSDVSRMLCREIMTRTLRTATASTSLREVAAMMRDGDIGAVPIVADDAKLVGIVTDRDIAVRSVSEGKHPDSAVGSAMTSELFTVGPDSFVFEAVRLMGDKQVRRVPVVNTDGTLAGIIAMADVALSTEDEQEIAQTIEEISSGSAFWQKS